MIRKIAYKEFTEMIRDGRFRWAAIVIFFLLIASLALGWKHWLLLVLVTPSCVNILVNSLYPVPARSEMVAALRDVQLDARRDGKRILADFYSNHPELRPQDSAAQVDNLGLAFVSIQQEQKQRGDEIEARFDEQLARQQSIVNRFRLLSPAIVLQETMNDLAGTGTGRYQHFRALVRNHAKAWDDYFVPKLYRQEKLTAADYDALPRFVFREENWADTTQRVLTGIASLVLPAMAIGLIGIRKLRRFPMSG